MSERSEVFERVGRISVRVQTQVDCDGDWYAQIPIFGITRTANTEAAAILSVCAAASFQERGVEP